jgi:hypothetical protein
LYRFTALTGPLHTFHNACRCIYLITSDEGSASAALLEGR